MSYKMENKPKFEPVRFTDWAHSSSLFAKDVIFLSEKKPNFRLPDTETNQTVRLNPVPLSQMNLSYLVTKPSVIGTTPARSATSIKIKKWNSSVKVRNKQRRMSEIKPHIRKTLNFTSEIKIPSSYKAENKPKLEPVRCADWAHDSGLFGKDVKFLSEKKPNSRSPDNETYQTVRLSPIPLSQMNLNFQVLKPSRVGMTPGQSATSIKKKKWNSSIKVVNKQRRISEIKSCIRKTLNFTSKMKTTDARAITIKETPHLEKLSLFIGEKSTLDSKKQVKISGIKRIPVTPPSQKLTPRKLQIQTPKLKTIQNSPPSSMSPKLCDSDSSFLNIEKLLDENILKENKDVNIASPMPTTPFLNNLRIDDSQKKSIPIFDLITNQIENENPVVEICDTLERTLKSRSYSKMGSEKERATLINIIQVVQNYLQEMEDFEKENTENRKIKSVTKNSMSILKSPSFKIKKKIIFQQNSPKYTHLSPKLEKNDAINVYMGLKKNLKFLDTPKTNRTRSNVMDTPARMKKNLQHQLNKLYSDEY